jgi:tripartite ATP-independent transporter DctM subunit
LLALLRTEHMRMDGLVQRLKPPASGHFQSLPTLAALAFAALLLLPSLDYARDEAGIVTPALGLSNAWRAAALPAGIGLMLWVSALRCWHALGLRRLVVGLAALGILAAALWLASAALSGHPQARLVLFFVVLVGAGVLSGVPIALCFGLGCLAYLSLATRLPLSVVAGRMDEGMSHIILLSVPLFIFLGLLLGISGMARATVAFLASLVGHLRGGLHYVLVGAMYLVSGISGSKVADMAAVAPALFPEMKARGADEGELAALLACTGAQTETIPPSLVLITIGSVAGVSIAALFAGGMLPGLFLGLLLCCVVWWRHRKDTPESGSRASGRQVARACMVALPALALPFIMRGAVVEGIATATEVSVIGIAYCLGYCVLLTLMRGQVPWRSVWPALVSTASLTGAILLIIGTATAMAWSLTQSGFSRELAQAMVTLPGGQATFMAVSIALFIVLGCVLEGIPAIVLFGPMLFPAARSLGISEVHYAVVVVVSMGVGLFSPPLGVGYYAACAIGQVPPARGVGHMASYLLALLAGLAVIAAVPSLTTALLPR